EDVTVTALPWTVVVLSAASTLVVVFNVLLASESDVPIACVEASASDCVESVCCCAVMFTAPCPITFAPARRVTVSVDVVVRIELAEVVPTPALAVGVEFIVALIDGTLAEMLIVLASRRVFLPIVVVVVAVIVKVPLAVAPPVRAPALALGRDSDVVLKLAP